MKEKNERSIQKVAAFVTRIVNEKVELLLFRHPSAGIQLPAGTVELGETVEDGVKREAAEETGLDNLVILEYLGTIQKELSSHLRVAARASKIFDAPSYDASSAGYALRRGAPVRITGEEGKFSAIVCDSLDKSQDPPIRISGITGYVRTSLLVKYVHRHLFHLTTNSKTPDEWAVFTDGLEFSLFWQRLKSIPQLHTSQLAWYEQAYPKLAAYYRPQSI